MTPEELRKRKNEVQKEKEKMKKKLMKELNQLLVEEFEKEYLNILPLINKAEKNEEVYFELPIPDINFEKYQDLLVAFKDNYKFNIEIEFNKIVLELFADYLSGKNYRISKNKKHISFFDGFEQADKYIEKMKKRESLQPFLNEEFEKDFSNLIPLLEKEVNKGSTYMMVPVPNVDYEKYKDIFNNYELHHTKDGKKTRAFCDFLKEKGYTINLYNNIIEF